METIEFIAHIATSTGVIAALGTFAWQLRTSQKTSEYESFLFALNQHRRLVDERKTRWLKIKEILSKDPKTAKEVHDTQNTIGYLTLRMEQEESFFAIEYELVGNELQSLNFMNELARIARRNKQARNMLRLVLADEVTFYQKNLTAIRRLYDYASKTSRQFKPQSGYLDKIDVAGWFDQGRTESKP